MELHKQTEKPLPYQWKDVTFWVRPHATVGDIHEFTTMGEVNKNGKVDIPRGIWYRKAIELFVVSWDGVTDEGKAVPFSLASLESLPEDREGGDIIFQLGAFIYNHCVGMLGEEKKKA